MEATVFLHFHSKCNFHIFRDEQRPKLHLAFAYDNKNICWKRKMSFYSPCVSCLDLKAFCHSLTSTQVYFCLFGHWSPWSFFLSNCCWHTVVICHELTRPDKHCCGKVKSCHPQLTCPSEGDFHLMQQEVFASSSAETSVQIQSKIQSKIQLRWM